MFTFEPIPLRGQHPSLSNDAKPKDVDAPVRAAAVRTRSAIDSSYLNKRGVPYVDQQRALIESDHNITVGMALAGTGKTTTAVGFTDARPYMKTLYLAFNTENAAQAKRRFGSHVHCKTPHGIAYSVLSAEQRSRVSPRWNPTAVRNVLQLKSHRAAATVWSILNDYFISEDDQIDPTRHGYSAMDRLGVDHDMVVRCAGYAHKLWQMMWATGSSTPIPHDAYFKRFALSRPNLGADLIVFDEAQDANAVTAGLVHDQHIEHGAKLLYLGDAHQSIYAFRGAVNAMQNLPQGAQCYPLTQSWRFGPNTAALANAVLAELKNESLQLEGMGQDRSWDSKAGYAYLARTNAELIDQAVAVQGQGVHWVGGVDRYRVDLLLDVWRLSTHKHHLIQDRFLSQNFSCWSEYEDAANLGADPEMRIMVKLVDTYGEDIPQLVDSLKSNEQGDATQCDLILTTAHRAKGLEFNQVKVGEDFEACASAEAWLSDKAVIDAFPEQEVNLLYVALTRTRSAVEPGSDLSQWLEQLPEHRARRKRSFEDSDGRHAGESVNRVHTQSVVGNPFASLSAPKF